MRLRVIATDYDGTIVSDGVLDPAVRAAIANARRRGVLVVIVTGRILSELSDVAGCLDFVDPNDVRNLESIMKRDGDVVGFVAGLCEAVERRYRSS